MAAATLPQLRTARQCLQVAVYGLKRRLRPRQPVVAGRPHKGDCKCLPRPFEAEFNLSFPSLKGQN